MNATFVPISRLHSLNGLTLFISLSDQFLHLAHCFKVPASERLRVNMGMIPDGRLARPRLDVVDLFYLLVVGPCWVHYTVALILLQALCVSPVVLVHLPYTRDALMYRGLLVYCYPIGSNALLAIRFVAFHHYMHL